MEHSGSSHSIVNQEIVDYIRGLFKTDKFIPYKWDEKQEPEQIRQYISTDVVSAAAPRYPEACDILQPQYEDS